MGLADGMAWERDYPTMIKMTTHEEKAWQLACDEAIKCKSVAFGMYDCWHDLPRQEQDKWLKLSSSNAED